MNANDLILEHFDYIKRLAESKCSSREDAEDLLSETFLAALDFIRRGGRIEYPKTWLSNTLMHKYNDTLRKKYGQPTIVELGDFGLTTSDEPEPDGEEAAAVRREIAYLTDISRETLIRFYYRGQSIADIASALGIPEGTVKSRLSAGREKIRKGLTDMENRENNLPGRLSLSFCGSDGANGSPISLVENDLIAQNLLMLAYDRPLTLPELSRSIGIPTAYIEPIAERLVSGELMAKTGVGKYYADFIIYNLSDQLERFKPQLDFVDRHFSEIWEVMSELTENLKRLELSLTDAQSVKLERYAILDALQTFQLYGSGIGRVECPPRRDGGKWMAFGYAFPADYDSAEYDRSLEYTVWGGRRTSGPGECDFEGAKYLKLCEFDTSLWDSPRRFNICGYELYFKYICNLLWSVSRGLAPEKCGLPERMLESIPGFIEAGLLRRENSTLRVDIPMLTLEEFAKVNRLISGAYEKLTDRLGSDYREFLRRSAVRTPAHLGNIPELFRYRPATSYIVMAVVRKAYELGLHLAGADRALPPVLLVYEKS